MEEMKDDEEEEVHEINDIEVHNETDEFTEKYLEESVVEERAELENAQIDQADLNHDSARACSDGYSSGGHMQDVINETKKEQQEKKPKRKNIFHPADDKKTALVEQDLPDEVNVGIDCQKHGFLKTP